MLYQETLIEQLRRCCQQDERLVAATLYGSFATGEGDAFSDVECALFFRTDALAGIDKGQWVAQIAPLLHFFADDFGHYTAIFEGLVRGEFHFEPAEKIAVVANWQGNAWIPDLDRAILVDRTGELRAQMGSLTVQPERDRPETAQRLVDNFVNLVIFGLNTLERGELARSLEILCLCHRYLLWMARLIEAATIHWPTPTRRLEGEISESAYKQFAACVATLERSSLSAAYGAAWSWGSVLASQLRQRHGFPLSERLFERVALRLSGWILHVSETVTQ